MTNATKKRRKIFAKYLYQKNPQRLVSKSPSKQCIFKAISSQKSS